MTHSCECPGCTDEARVAVAWRSSTSVYCNWHAEQTQIEFPSANAVGTKGENEPPEIWDND